MNRDFIARYWYAYIYEQQENHTYDYEFLLKLLDEQCGGKSQNILEAACGGGRMSVPLAKAGHNVTGFDADEYMLLRCVRRMEGIPNLHVYHMDGTETDWGTGYDVVLMAANLLINIESKMDYAKAQASMIRSAANALRPGGHLYMAFDLHADPSRVFNGLKESSYFKGEDDMGTYGQTFGYGGAYDPVTRITAYPQHTEITLSNGEKFTVGDYWHKHIPSQEQVYGWLADAGLVIERTYKNFTDEPIPEPAEGYCKASIWAKKTG